MTKTLHIKTKIFTDKSLKIYGINVPKIVKVLPTNLPEISANELRIDNLFLLEDGTIAIIDYESAYKKENRNKYINYIARVLKRYEEQGELDIKIRMIVIYTADVSRENVSSGFDMGAMKLEIESAFLSELDSDEIMKNLTDKINNGEALSDEEMMEFIVLPLAYKEKERKKFAIKETFELAKKIKDDEVMTFVLTGLLVFTDKVIDDEMSSKIKEWIDMTKVGRLYQAEKDTELAKKDAELAEEKAQRAKEKVELTEAKYRIKELEAALAAK